ncbi:hypothetical protein [Nibribacter koreensis]|uniref:DUF4136 domain-containing protein n=1 Tax=Nibribacter koreensis TaxID=1084519 RepID=A0ABP8FY19_9BACT
MKKRISSLFLAVVLLQSCVSTEEAAKIVKPGEIEKVGYFSATSYISMVEKGNNGSHNEEMSREAAARIDSLVKVQSQTFRVQASLSPEGDALAAKVDKEIEALLLQVMNRRRAYNVTLSPTIDSLMEASGERFALTILSSGFSRVKGNYGGQVAKGIGVGILTLGMYTPLPIKANSTLHAMVFDAKNNTVALYKRSQLLDKEPMDQKVMTKQVNFLLSSLLMAK